MFVARDRFGIKPLYCAEHNRRLYFASEIKALLRRFYLLIRRVLPASHDYFSFQFCLGEKTMLNGVRQLPAAHSAVVEPGKAAAIPSLLGSALRAGLGTITDKWVR